MTHPRRTLHFSLRVSDLDQSLAFYSALGYEVVGGVPETAFGTLTMLKLPGDPHVAIELASGSGDGPSGTNMQHFVVMVPSMTRALDDLTAAGIHTETPSSPDGSESFLTSWVNDPDGNRIELVQWPEGHTVGMTEADFR